ncbi:Ion transport protein-domain-containing protein [Mycotypha africana]|uniref:Ion transport protein-domain-containing protein n=1 Tax=Mycotypha africana TaxID=64632 RepID=UPI0023014BAC|nr:Ion transport protein-domain-containing protein [Mycotypha africana]KAI8967340.1 Ion transport protein-domain-containing protein [Mycotypha africana]
MNAFTRRCAVMPEEGRLYQGMTDIHYVEPRTSCAGYMVSPKERTGPFDLKTGTQYIHPGTDGFFCKLGQVCIQDRANQPEYGFMSYENIFYSMLNVLTVISTENWTELLYITQDSVSDKGAAVFYTFCIFLMTFVLVPMFIAVITTSFSHLRGDMRESAFSSKRKAPMILSEKQSRSYKARSEELKKTVVNGNMFGNDYSHRPSILHRWTQYISADPRFRYLRSLLVALNIVLMMFYRSDLTVQQKNYLDSLNLLCTIIFAVEIVMRILSYSKWKRFWKKPRNRIDFIIVIATLVGLLAPVRSSQYHALLVVFPVIRSYRLVYLFPGVLQLISDIVSDGQGIRNLTIFTFLVLLLFSPISVQLFGGGFQFVGIDEPSMRFDNSYQAFLALFQIMTGENWTDILYDAMHSQDESSIPYASLFIVLLYFIIHYIVLNLFIAVIMENFDLDEEEIKQYQIRKYIHEHQWKSENFRMDKLGRQDKKKLQLKNLPQNVTALVTVSKFEDFMRRSSSIGTFKQETRGGHINQLPLHSRSEISTAIHRRPSSVFSSETPIPNIRRHSNYSQVSISSLQLEALTTSYTDFENENQTKYDDEYEFNVAQENKAVILENLKAFRSFVFFKMDSLIRQICIKVLAKERYNHLMIALISVTTLLAMWTDELNREKYSTHVNHIIEPIQAILLFVYWIDIFIHMTADGVFMLPKSYLRSGWNILDMTDLFLQVIFTILSLSTNGFDSDRIKIFISCLRILRVWRSVRIVYYVNTMRTIFVDLVYGLPKMIDAVTLNILVFVPFAIYGCYLFSGRFSLCNDKDVGSKAECYGEYLTNEDGISQILLPKVWRNPYDYSFDTFGQALLHLFECASGEGWILSLFSAMSVVPGDSSLPPHFNWSSTSVYHSIYYVVFMFVASLCSIQLFIGVFLEIFKQRNGISTLTNTQRQFRDLQRQLALYLHQPTWLSKIQEALNALCLCCYVFEMFAKIVGLGFYKWVFNRWNMHDFVFVSLAIITSIPKMYPELPFGWDVTRKVVLIGIAFRLAQRNESLNILFRSVKRAIPSIFSVTFVFFIVIICFGVVFQELFSTTRYGMYGNEHANFRSLYNTILTLFRVTTGENWDFLMHDYTKSAPECVDKKDCGSPRLAITLFVIFYVICTYIFVNLFTVIVIDHFSFTFDKRNQFTLITRTDLRNFKRAWSAIDPKATGYINFDDVPKFLNTLEGALSIRVYGAEHSLDSLLEVSNRPSADADRLIVIPLSDMTTPHNKFARVNEMGEKLFNLHELNKKLSNIQREVIIERKRQYAEIYQEIKNTASHRGVAFQKMLEILALRLVDVSKSLTFEELVNRAKIEDKIANDLYNERAKGLVAMVLQRRRLLKKLSKFRSSHEMCSGNSLELLKSWLTPVSPPPTAESVSSSIFTKRATPTVQSPAVQTDSPSSFQSEPSIFTFPKIVVNPARQQNVDNLAIAFSPNSASQPPFLFLSDTCSTIPSNNAVLQRRRSSSAINISTPNTLSTMRRSNPTCNTTTNLSSSSSETSSVVSVISLPEQPILRNTKPVLLLKSTSLTANNEGSDDQNDIFIHYYAADTAMENMLCKDADRITERLDKSFWYTLLQDATDYDI